MTRKIITGIVLLIVLFSQASFADKIMTGDPEKQTMPASTKLWRGLVNTFTGIGEIVRQPVLAVKKEGGWHLPNGLINGVIMSFARTGAGIAEVITFPVPFDEEIGYDSLLNPDYVWQKADCDYMP